ncbi:MAG: hypothetical protein D6815_10090 [Candidatus Dadabacteria bacterium]|nr:MAG: hypothetical protein D6815_10090 [Candidatus Dadabacteria bacterium]
MASSDSEFELPAHFAIPVEVPGPLKTELLEVGVSVTLRVTHDVMWHGCTVVREGAPVHATVIELSRRGPIGKPAVIVVRIDHVIAADGQKLPLHGRLRSNGEGREMEAIGAAWGVCCLGIFLPGGKRDIGCGTGTIAFTVAPVKLQCIAD